jgi:hypothetical protein
MGIGLLVGECLDEMASSFLCFVWYSTHDDIVDFHFVYVLHIMEE